MSAGPRIGIYVHHHGGGHAARAGTIGAALAERGVAVSFLSSLPSERLGQGETVTLPLDTDLGTEPGQTPAALHFAPLGSAGLAAQMAAIATWIECRRPRLLLVDVSVEVALLSRLCGVPFAYLRQSGERGNQPHLLAYDWAAGLLAPFAERFDRTRTPAWMREKAGHVGAVTRFDGGRRPEAEGRAAEVLRRGAGSSAAGRPRRVLVLGECGPLTEEIAAGAPEWEVLGPRPVDLDLLASCAVVVAPVAPSRSPRPPSRVAASSACRSRDPSPSRPLAVRTSSATVPRSSSGGRPSRGNGRCCSRRRAAAARRSNTWADGGGAARAADYLVALARVPVDQPHRRELSQPAPGRPIAPALAMAARVGDQSGNALGSQAGRRMVLVEGERAADPGQRHAGPCRPHRQVGVLDPVAQVALVEATDPRLERSPSAPRS